MIVTPRQRVAAALAHVEPDRCPFQSTFTPEFAVRLRRDLGLGHEHGHNPHGGGNTYELELAIGEDVLLTSVGWANCYYQALRWRSRIEAWGVGTCPGRKASGATRHRRSPP